MNFRDMPIRRKVTVVIMAACVLVVGLAMLGLTLFEWRHYRVRAVADARALTDMITVSIYAAVDFDDQASAEETLASLRGARDVVSADLVKLDGSPFAHYQRANERALPALTSRPDGAYFEETGLIFVQTLARDGRPFARLWLRSDLSGLRAEWRQTLVLLVGVLLVLLAVAFGVAAALQRTITTPLLALSATTRAVTENNDYTLRATRLSADEVGELAQSFNQMLAAIEANETALRASQQLLNSVVNNTPAVINVKDLEGRFRMVNEHFLRLFGRGAADLRGRTDYDIFPPEIADAFRVNDRKVIESGATIHVEEIAPHSDGPHTYISAKFPLRDPKGAIEGVGSISTDITDLKRAELALRHENTFRQHVINSATEGICVCEETTAPPYIRFSVWNERMTELTGFSIEEINRRGWYQSVYPDPAVQERARQRMERMRMGDDLNGEEWEITRADGVRRQVIISTRLVRVEGYPPQVLAVLYDITDRKRAEQEIRELNAVLETRVRERTEELARRVAEVEKLNRDMVNLLHDLQEARDVAETTAGRLAEANAQLTAANQELESFSYSVSHDLRAPLRHISGFTNLLAGLPSAKADPQAARFAQIISQSARRMGTLIDDLLAFSKMSRASLHLGPVSLDQLVGQVRADLEHDAVGRTICWKIDPLPTVSGDESLLRQVFANLLGNAVKYTRTRAEAVIEVGGRVSGREAVVCVRDNGVGFDMKYADKLFGVFQRLHRDEEFEGTGIGLATVQRIVHRHGGHIRAEATVNGGAAFWVTLPLATASASEPRPHVAP